MVAENKNFEIEWIYAQYEEGMSVTAIAAELGKSEADKKQFYAELTENAGKLSDIILTSETALSLGSDIRGREIYTTKALKEREDRVLRYVESLLSRSTKQVKASSVKRCVSKQERRLSKQIGGRVTFSEAQNRAVQFLSEGPDIRVVIGRAGTGKTTIMEPVVRAYEKAGYRVLGTAFQGKTTENMERDIGIECHTIDFFNYRWKKCQNYEQLIAKNKVRG